jgi:hypothetical protein
MLVSKFRPTYVLPHEESNKRLYSCGENRGNIMIDRRLLMELFPGARLVPQFPYGECLVILSQLVA